MTVEIRVFSIQVPAGTAQATPQVTPMRMPARRVDAIEVEVPPGPRGEVGFRIGSSGTQLIPLDPGTWIVSDDHEFSWPIEHAHDSGSWEFTAYNTGLFPHTLQCRFLVTPPQLVAASTAPIDAASLGAVPVAAPGVGLPGFTLPQLPPPPVASIPTPPNLIPPVAPALSPPGQVPALVAWTRRARQDLVVSYGGAYHVFRIDNAGQLWVHTFARKWTVEAISWATGLVPAGLLAGGQAAGQAHVFAPLQAGGVLHLVQPETGGDASSWGGEIFGGA